MEKKKKMMKKVCWHVCFIKSIFSDMFHKQKIKFLLEKRTNNNNTKKKFFFIIINWPINFFLRHHHHVSILCWRNQMMSLFLKKEKDREKLDRETHKGFIILRTNKNTRRIHGSINFLCVCSKKQTKHNVYVIQYQFFIR